MKIIYIFLCMISLVIPVDSFGASYYVKTGGDDTAAGTADGTAWANCPGMSGWSPGGSGNSITSGDTVYFRSQDTWTGSPPGTNFTAAVLETKEGVTYDGSTYGTGTRATLKSTGDYVGIYIVPVLNVEKSNVTVTGFNIDGDDHIIGGLWVCSHPTADVDNVLIDDCKIHDTMGEYGRGFFVGPTKANTTCSNITLQNSEIYNIHQQAGVVVYPSWSYPNSRANKITIRNCIIRDTSGSDSLGVYVKDDADNVTIEYCTICRNLYGVYIATVENEIIGVPNSLIIRYNIVYDNDFAGIVAGNAGNRTYDFDFYGNVFYDNGHAGQTQAVDMLIAGGNFGSSVFNIYNNTFYSTKNGAYSYKYILHLGNFGGGTGVTGTPTINFKNNILYTKGYPAIWDINDVMTHSNNLIFRDDLETDTHVKLGTNQSYTLYDRDGTASDLTNWEATAKKADPAFTGGTFPTGFMGTYGTDMVPNTNYFAIISGDALDSGSTLGAPYNSSINSAGLAVPFTRPQGAGYDLGAYEYDNSTDITAPEMTAFTIPATGSRLLVTFTVPPAATDATGVTGYLVHESASQPTLDESASDTSSGWSETAQTSFTFADWGERTLYAWAKDAAGNISTSLSDSITLAEITKSTHTAGGSFNIR